MGAAPRACPYASMRQAIASLALLVPGGCFLVPVAIAAGAAELEHDTPVGTPAVVHGSLAGGRNRADATWAPADEMPYVALDADRQFNDGSPLWLASWFGVGYTDDVPAASPRGQGATSTIDFGLGVRHYRAFGPVEPFVGAGAAFVDRCFSYTDAEPGNLYDYSVGGYLECGVDVAVHQNIVLGVMVRHYQGTDQSIADREFDADTTTFMVTFGLRR